jgi:hypothetical protein
MINSREASEFLKLYQASRQLKKSIKGYPSTPRGLFANRFALNPSCCWEQHRPTTRTLRVVPVSRLSGEFHRGGRGWKGRRAAWARETLQIWRTSFGFAQSPAPILSLVLPVFALRFGGIAVPACSNPRTEILACGIPPDSCGSSLPEMDAVDFGWEPGARKFGFRFSASSWID